MKMPLIKKIIGKDKDLLVTEIGHSAPVGGLTVGPRSREIYLLHVVTKGYCDFSGFRVQAGQAFFISKGRLHSFTVSDGYEHYWIGFTGSAAEGLLAQFSLSADLHRLFYVEDPAFAQSLFALTLSALEDAENERAAPIALSLLTALLPLLKKEKHSHTPRKANYAEQARIRNLRMCFYRACQVR